MTVLSWKILMWNFILNICPGFHSLKGVATEKTYIFYLFVVFVVVVLSLEVSRQKWSGARFLQLQIQICKGQEMIFFGVYVGKVEWRRHRILHQALPAITFNLLYHSAQFASAWLKDFKWDLLYILPSWRAQCYSDWVLKPLGSNPSSAT